MNLDKRNEVFCVQLDEWLDGGLSADEQLRAIELRFVEGLMVREVVAIIAEERQPA